MSVFHNNILGGAASAAGGAAAGYQIDRSLRFNRGDSAHLSRTPSSAGNSKIFTLSCWYKKTNPSASGVYQAIFDANNGSDYFTLYTDDDGTDLLRLYIRTGGTNYNLKTTQIFRDYSAWMHIVVAVDTTQSTEANRIKLYINGSQVTDFRTATYPPHNSELSVNKTNAHFIGGRSGQSAFYLNGYLAETYFIDGQALAASDFGEEDSNGVWQPKEFTGSYDQRVGGRTIANSSGALPILNTSDDYGDTISSGVRSDSNSSNIVLALPLNGSNNGTTITDYHHTIKGSGSAKTVSIFTGDASGGAVTSTAQSRYYGSSFYAVRGTTNDYDDSDYIYRTGDSDLAFGTGSFCVEFWYRPGTFVQNSTMFDNRHNSNDWPNSTAGFQFFTNHNGDLYLRTGSGYIISASSKLTEGEWAHLAVTGDYSGSNRTIRVFCNGTLAGSATNNNDFSEGRFHLGSAANNGEGSNGYYADLRIYKGVAKYTSNFNVPEAGEGGVNSFYLKFADNSSNDALGTDSSGLSNTWDDNNLTAAAGALSASRGSNYDTESSTYTEYGTVSQASSVSLPMSNNGHYDSAALRVNSGGFKAETTNSASTEFFMACWVKFDSLTNGNQMGVNIGGDYVYWEVRSSGDVKVRHVSPGSSGTSSTSPLSTNTWHHIALSRSGNTLTGFVDGDAVITASCGNATTTVTANEEFNFFGQSGTSYNMAGYLLDAVVYVGAGRTADYTVPSSPLITSSGSINDVAGMSASNRVYASNLISVGTSGGDVDSLIDTPTNYEASSGNNNGGNYATLNRLNANLNSTTISQGNLTWVKTSASNFAIGYGTIGVSSGKYYYEATVNSYSGNFNIGWNNAVGGPYADADTNAAFYSLDGGVIRQRVNTTSSSIVASNKATSTGIIGMAIDCDNNTVSFYHNNSLQYTVTGMTADTYFPRIYVDGGGNASNVDFNFGQRPFAYTPPTGYKSLCTQNLADPTIANGSDYFDTKLYTGTNSAKTISGYSFSPDLVWIKKRSADASSNLLDTVRGERKHIESDTTNDEETESANVGLTAFTSDGFSLGTDNVGAGQVNNNGGTFVAWAWDAGSSTVSNDVGSITSSVRANTSAGFSIVTYTGTGSNATVGHGLNAVPGLVIVKSRSATSLTGWMTKHSSLSSNYNLALNLADSAWNPSTNGWVGDLTSSTTFSLVNGSADGNNVNQNNTTFVAYCFAPVEGYSKFGSYQASSSLPFIYTGFRVAFLMVKNISSGSTNWRIMDSTRDTFNDGSGAKWLKPSSDGSEVDERAVDFLSNGFKMRMTDGGDINYSTDNYIYAAFAEHPFKTARAR